MDFYDYFVDEMEEGNFKTFKHQHFFEEINGVTIMTDLLEYETPFGILSKAFDFLFLKKHLSHFIKKRNEFIKYLAKTNKQIYQKNGIFSTKMKYNI
jgi:ligand-binding SRPBCC domain-containing protein